MYAIGRPINGISLNGDEYLLGEDGEVMTWEHGEDAINHLMTIGFFYNEEIGEFMDDGSTIVYIREYFK